MHDLNQKLNSVYPKKVVRKDLTKRIKEGANVPVYVLEYLLEIYFLRRSVRRSIGILMMQ
jgi:ATP-dependent Lon protease